MFVSIRSVFQTALCQNGKSVQFWSVLFLSEDGRVRFQYYVQSHVHMYMQWYLLKDPLRACTLALAIRKVDTLDPGSGSYPSNVQDLSTTIAYNKHICEHNSYDAHELKPNGLEQNVVQVY